MPEASRHVVASTTSRYDYVLKCTLVGNSGVGKSSIMRRLLDTPDNSPLDATIGVEFGCCDIDVSGRRVKVQMWDTAGQEKYRAVARSYLRDAALTLLVYDATDAVSFSTLPYWLREVRQHAPSTCVMLLGNKCDAVGGIVVSGAEAKRLAKAHGVSSFLETSATTGHNVRSALVSGVSSVLTDVESGTLDLNEKHGVRVGTGRPVPLQPLHPGLGASYQPSNCCV